MLAARAPAGDIFGAAERLECSWTLGEAWLPHQRLELENDLIAAHVLGTGQVPAAQFLGEQAHGTAPAAGQQPHESNT